MPNGNRRLTKAERADIAQTKYAERMAARAAKLGTPTVRLLARLAHLGWHPDALAHEMGMSAHLIRSWAEGETAPGAAIDAMMDMVARSEADDAEG